jgi:hypothetical protein
MEQITLRPARGHENGQFAEQLMQAIVDAGAFFVAKTP